MVERKSKEQIPIPKLYSPRIEFKRNVNGSSIESKIIFRLERKRKKREISIEVPEDIGDLSWTRYHGQIISNYHRREDGLYINRGELAYDNLNQKLEKLFVENIKKYFIKNQIKNK